jgi:hypothetical protein
MRLSLRFQKLSYAGATCLCLAVSIAVVVWAGTTTYVARSTAVGQGPVAGSAAARPDGIRELTCQDFAKLYQRPLRRPLYDPPPPKPVVQQPPALRVELLGTILEEANSMAIVRSEKGDVQYKGVGDAVGPAGATANIVEIGSNSIIVEREKQRITLNVQSKDLQ